MHGRQSGWALLLSVALWAPTAQRTLAGDIDLIPALVRYLAALAVASIAVIALSRVTDGYRLAVLQSASRDEPASTEAGEAADTVLDATTVLDAVGELDLDGSPAQS